MQPTFIQLHGKNNFRAYVQLSHIVKLVPEKEGTQVFYFDGKVENSIWDERDCADLIDYLRKYALIL